MLNLQVLNGLLRIALQNRSRPDSHTTYQQAKRQDQHTSSSSISTLHLLTVSNSIPPRTILVWNRLPADHCCCWGSLFDIIQERVGEPCLLMGISAWPWSKPKWRVLSCAIGPGAQVPPRKADWSHSGRRKVTGYNFLLLLPFYLIAFFLSDCNLTFFSLVSPLCTIKEMSSSTV